MELKTHPIELASPVVLDASVAINLIASGQAAHLIGAFPHRFVVTSIVAEEMEAGQQRAERNVDGFRQLVSQDFIEIVELSEPGITTFEALVVGAARETLDDGEASTIAHAIHFGGVALIDEKKARRICAERYRSLRVGCTLDIFAHPNVHGRFRNSELVVAVLGALQGARMRVPPEYEAWVIDLIGEDMAAMCPSLPNRMSSP